MMRTYFICFLVVKGKKRLDVCRPRKKMFMQYHQKQQPS